MPLYEFECPEGHRFELLLNPKIDNIELATCEEEIGENEFCGLDAEMLWPMTCMKPDKYWAGHVVNGAYVTSESQINKDIVPATRETREYIAKQKVKVKQEIEEKASNNLRKFLAEELKGVDASPDGYSQKERDSYVRARKQPADANSGTASHWGEG